VLNSFFEGWSLASMEALCAGVPVVGSDVVGAREQLGTDRSRGYLIRNPLGDPLDVNWTAIEAVAYARQTNREELTEAMCALVPEGEQQPAARRAGLDLLQSQRRGLILLNARVPTPTFYILASPAACLLIAPPLEIRTDTASGIVTRWIHRGRRSAHA
jgi:hypothetical protein